MPTKKCGSPLRCPLHVCFLLFHRVTLPRYATNYSYPLRPRRIFSFLCTSFVCIMSEALYGHTQGSSPCTIITNPTLQANHRCSKYPSCIHSKCLIFTFASHYKPEANHYCRYYNKCKFKHLPTPS